MTHRTLINFISLAMFITASCTHSSLTGVNEKSLVSQGWVLVETIKEPSKGSKMLTSIRSIPKTSMKIIIGSSKHFVAPKNNKEFLVYIIGKNNKAMGAYVFSRDIKRNKVTDTP